MTIPQTMQIMPQPVIQGSPFGTFERLLVVGMPGTGKTYNWLRIAEWLPKRRFHVIDPDDGVDRVRYGSSDGINRDFKDMDNISYYLTPSWFGELVSIGKDRWMGGTAQAFHKIKKDFKPGDWIILEQLGILWENVQSGFTDEVFDKDIGMYFLERRKQMQTEIDNANAAQQTQKRQMRDGLGAFDGWKDWVVINKLFNADLIMPLCYSLRAHVYITSTISIFDSKQLQAMKKTEEPVLQMMYGSSPFRIDGQKHVPVKMQSIIMTAGNPNDGFKMSTFIKDRGRRWMRMVPIVNFPVQYLVAIGKWPLNPDG